MLGSQVCYLIRPVVLFIQTVAMSNLINSPSSQRNPDNANALSQTVVYAIKELVCVLSPADRARVLREITEIIRPIPVARAGKVLGAIVRILPAQKRWTVDQLKQSIADQGIEAPPKEVYNAVGYLVRKGHIRRVGYGRYIVEGIEVVTSEDLGAPSSRYEDDPRLFPSC
jgi:hypothetical protein